MILKHSVIKHVFKLCKSRNASVSTWNSLASAFNVPSKRKYDFYAKNVGLFKNPNLNTPEGFELEKNNAIREGWELLDKAVKCKPGEETVVLFDELSDTLCRVADLADFIRSAHPDPSYCDAANKAHLSIGTMVEELNTNIKLYNSLKRVTEDAGVINELDEETATVANLFMFDFKISGIHLDNNKRQQAVQLHEEILQLTSLFLQRANSPVLFPKEDIPEILHNHFQQDGGNIVVNSLHCGHHDEMVRESAYRLFYYDNPNLDAILTRLLQARLEVAQLVGYESYAERALISTMSRKPETVFKFLNQLSSKLKPLADNDYEKMRALKLKNSSNQSPLMQWDLQYYTSKIREESAIDPTLYSAYFSLGDCMGGLSNLFESLYGVTLHTVQWEKGEVWSNDVIKVAVMQDSEVLGYIYCDFFNRPGKPQQDCHFTIRGGRRKRDGSYQAPIVVLMLHLCSVNKSNIPPLLTPTAMNNLFHEMGHAMHSMLARTRYQHVTGTRCATDFAEVPSILMEYFATDSKVLSTFARHYKTRESLPDNMIKKICESDKVCAAAEMQSQVFYSLMDQKFHSKNMKQYSINDMVTQVHNEHYSLPIIQNSAWHLRFTHLASYGAKYYSYLMSRAVAARLWKQCFEADPFNREVGTRYRTEILQHGGGKDPVSMYEDMLKEPFDTDVLIETLLQDIQT